MRNIGMSLVFLCACFGDTDDPLEADNLGDGTITAEVSCPPKLAVFPVRGRHNTGSDPNTDKPNLWTCDDARSNSDFTSGRHLGNDIWAAQGTPLAASVDGTLRYVANSSYSGNKLTIVDKCGYYHFYAHMNGFGPGISPASSNGKRVHAGQIVGFVGHTGTASNGVNHLHYSIYPNDNYSAGVNPYPYLHAVEHATCAAPKRGDTPVDFDGDGKSDIAVWRPSTGIWYIDGEPNVEYGTAGDIPVPADYNGDGKTDRAVWRPSNGTWYLLGQGSTVYGTAGDIPVPGDYDGDGKAELAVWRPSNGTWYIHGGSTVYGEAGDVPVPADYDGDGTIDRAVWRPSTGTWFVAGETPVVYGQKGDVPVPADYNGDGRADLAVWRPSNGTWYVLGQGSVVYGQAGDIPNPADYSGDGRAERAVFRPATGTWFILGVGSKQYGVAGDQPLTQ